MSHKLGLIHKCIAIIHNTNQVHNLFIPFCLRICYLQHVPHQQNLETEETFFTLYAKDSTPHAIFAYGWT
jgi:hypothetical protein